MTQRRRLSKVRVASCLTAFCAMLVVRGAIPEYDDSEKPLPVDEAFSLDFALIDDSVHLRWIIADGYYLYRQSIDVIVGGKSVREDLDLPSGTTQQDAVFGEVEVYHQTLEFVIPNVIASAESRFTVRTQGCMENVFCYVPRTRAFTIQMGEINELMASDSEVGTNGGIRWWTD